MRHWTQRILRVAAPAAGVLLLLSAWLPASDGSPVLAPGTEVAIGLELARPVESADSPADLRDALVSRLVWRLRSEGRPPAGAPSLRLYGVLVEGARVVGSARSRTFRPRSDAGVAAEAVGASHLLAMLEKCCTPDTEGGLLVRALPGSRFLAEEQLSQGIVDIAERAVVNGIFLVDSPVKVNWRTDAVIVLSAAADDGSAITRPLLLVVSAAP